MIQYVNRKNDTYYLKVMPRRFEKISTPILPSSWRNMRKA
jgi:hypothetical protein